MPQDPDPTLDPLALQAERNFRLTGFSPGVIGRADVDLVREEDRIETRHDGQPGGGTRVLKVPDPHDVRDVLTDHAERLESLGLSGTGRGTMPAVADQRGW